MNKGKYIIPLFLGTLGFLYSASIDVGYRNNFFDLFIAIAAAALLGHGFNLVEENYEKNKVGKIKTILLILLVLVYIITESLSYYNPIASFSIGALLALISLVSVSLIYK